MTNTKDSSERRAALAIRLNAGNDGNGNPRRVFVVFNGNGTILEAIDEGYDGTSALYSKYPEAHELWVNSFPTTPAEYRGLIKAYGSK